MKMSPSTGKIVVLDFVLIKRKAAAIRNGLYMGRVEVTAPELTFGCTGSESPAFHNNNNPLTKWSPLCTNIIFRIIL